MRQLRLSALLATAVLALTSCADAGGVAATTVSSDFESGNLGTVTKLDETRWVLSLPDDNDNPDLPDTWRAWWYVRFDAVTTAEPMSITVDNNAWPYYYVPVYSYDQKVWHRFDEAEVTRPDGNSTRMVKRFDESTVALNLHSSNSEPDTAAFFYPHFGPAALGYSEDEARLWSQQLSFIDSVEAFYGAGRIEPRPVEGGASFATSNFPESWWWHNRRSEVMAITLETVYGRAGFAPRWVTPPDLRALGRAVALALLEYHGLPVTQGRR